MGFGVAAAGVGRNDAEALFGVELLHGSCWHVHSFRALGSPALTHPKGPRDLPKKTKGLRLSKLTARNEGFRTYKTSPIFLVAANALRVRQSPAGRISRSSGFFLSLMCRTGGQRMVAIRLRHHALATSTAIEDGPLGGRPHLQEKSRFLRRAAAVVIPTPFSHPLSGQELLVLASRRGQRARRRAKRRPTRLRLPAALAAKSRTG
jgi:hypothetical protein